MSAAFLSLAFLLSSCPAGKPSSIANGSPVTSIIYTGNMGILINSEKTAVWIDGLHEYYGQDYLNPPDSLLEKSFSGTGPFAPLKWLLFTHYHRDHFSKKLATRFLRIKQDAKVIAAPQVVDSFSVKVVVNAWNKNGQLIHDDAAGLRIYAFNVPHVWPQRHNKVQNIAYLVEINGVRILHAGDADTDEGAFERIGISSVDVAIIPQWFDSEKGRSIIKKLKPQKVIVTHIAPVEKSAEDNVLKNQELIFFERIGQTVTL